MAKAGQASTSFPSAGWTQDTNRTLSVALTAPSILMRDCRVFVLAGVFSHENNHAVFRRVFVFRMRTIIWKKHQLLCTNLVHRGMRAAGVILIIAGVVLC